MVRITRLHELISQNPKPGDFFCFPPHNPSDVWELLGLVGAGDEEEEDEEEDDGDEEQYPEWHYRRLVENCRDTRANPLMVQGSLGPWPRCIVYWADSDDPNGQ